MEPSAAAASAPPVVAVMVVHEPGPWFDEVLDSVAGQDYPNLKRLFLVVGEPGDLPGRIRRRVPDAFVRGVAAPRGFGAAANEVVRIVEGSRGLFCFLHDDVALERSAIRSMVEELYRSNAGIVGPKIVEWARPRVLQHVGLAVDRFGEVDPLIEPGEVDQEQHDAVRDVFAVPSTCLLVRADLFRSIGGFDRSIDGRGDDIDLCWRAHLSGARVMVAPSARVRHRGPDAERRADPHGRAERNRLYSVLSLTGLRRLVLVLPQLLVLTLLEAVGALVLGRLRRSLATLAALTATVARLPAILVRRRAVAALRRVPDTEVAALQASGSARLSAVVRGRHRDVDPDDLGERRWRETAGSAPFVAWAVVLVLFAIGSRRLLRDGVPQFGEFLAFGESPREMWSAFASGWSGHGVGATRASPTGLGLLAVGSVLTLWHAGLLHTIAVIGCMLIGISGAYRLGSLFPSVRARLAVLVVYAALPLPSQLLAAGQWTGLVAYAVMPWVVHLLRRLSGIDAFAVADGDRDGVVRVSRRRRRRILAQLVLVAAVAGAFAPSVVVLLLIVGLVLALTTAAVGSGWRVAMVWWWGALVAAVGAVIANMPWSATLFGDGGWTAVSGVPADGGAGLGFARLATFEVGVGVLTTVAAVLHLPVVVAPLVARSWRFAWAARAGGLVTVFGALAVVDDRGLLPMRLFPTGVALVPVALGVALAAGCIGAAFEIDVLRGSFGWRQPLGVLSAVAIVVGVLPGVVAAGDGKWNMPPRTLATVLGEFPEDPPEGDYRILWIGDHRVVPVGAWRYADGIGYAITDDGPLTIADRWAGRPSRVERDVAEALGKIAIGETLRGGRLLAPFGIRFVVVPIADGFNGTIDRPLTPPGGLVEVLDDQLDLASPFTTPPNYLVFENTAYAPTRAVLTPTGAAASARAGDEAGTRTDLSGSLPFAVGAGDRGPFVDEMPAGTLHVAVPFDTRWRLTVDGAGITPRRSFGSAVAFDAPLGGLAELRYDGGPWRALWLVALGALWGALAISSTRWEPLRWWAARRAGRGSAPTDDLGAPGDSGVLAAALGVPGTAAPVRSAGHVDLATGAADDDVDLWDLGGLDPSSMVDTGDDPWASSAPEPPLPSSDPEEDPA